MAGTAGMETGKAFDLLTDLRRGVQEDPTRSVRADRHGFLRPGRGADAPGANAQTVRAPAVPLWKAAARCRSQHADAHASAPRRRRLGRSVAQAGTSQAVSSRTSFIVSSSCESSVT